MKELIFDETGIETLLVSAETVLGVHLTLHDLTGVFHDGKGGLLVGPNRQSHHQFAACADSGLPLSVCIRHCATEVHRRAESARHPFAHVCPAGYVEIVAPMRRNGVLHALLFAGVWNSRTGKYRKKATSGSSAQEPPPFDEFRAADFAALLRLLADGLLDQAFSAGEQSAESPLITRREQILRFIRNRGNRKGLELKDIAAELHLSSSRTCHLVREIFGRPFIQLVREERVRQAADLLLTTDLTARQIAYQIGLESPSYFNRLFQEVHGLTPCAFRLKRRSDQAEDSGSPNPEP